MRISSPVLQIQLPTKRQPALHNAIPSPLPIVPVTFAGARSSQDIIHMVGVYSPGSGYLAEVEATFTGVYNYARQLRGKTKLGSLPLQWQKDYPKSFTPMFSTVKVPHYDLDRSAFVAMQLRQPRPNNSVFMSFNQQRGSDDRTRYCLITTAKHGTYIGPPNSTLRSIQTMLEENRIPHQLLALDLDKVDRFLTRYQQSKSPAVNLGWAGRDIYATVMGAIMAGLDPKTFAHPGKPVDLPASSPFITSIAETSRQPLAVGQSTKCKMIFDLDGPGDLKLGWSMTKPAVTALVKENPRFRVECNGRVVDNVCLREKYQDAQDKQAVIISSSTHALKPDHYLFELGIRNASIAEALGIGEKDMAPIQDAVITRTQ